MIPGSRYPSCSVISISILTTFWLSLMVPAAPMAQTRAQRASDVADAAPAQPGTATSDISAEARSQIAALIEEKERRTPAQQKMDSQLVYAVKMARGEAIAAGVTDLQIGVAKGATGDTLIVDVRA